MNVLLIGDSCEDRYFYGDAKRLSPEAPVPILEYRRGVTSQGMAMNVFNNLKAFGVSINMITNEEKIIKTRFIDEKSNQQILRSDEEPEIKPFPYKMPENKYDILVISDYNKGFISQEKMFELVEWFDGPVFIDTKKRYVTDRCYVKVNDM